MKHYWRIAVRQGFGFLFFGFVITALIAVGIVWHIPVLGKRSYAVYLPDIFS